MEGNQANKQTRGKQRITMEMIDDEDNRLITFSKRRSGIYKKASELITLCGADIAVAIFSPSGKLFSFGHPSADAVVDKFMGDGSAPKPGDSVVQPIVEAFRRQKVEELNEINDSLFDRLEDEKALGKALARKLSGMPVVSGKRQQRAVDEEDEEEEDDEEEQEQEQEEEVSNKEKQLWEAPLEGLAPDVLEEKYRSLEELHNKFSSHVKERLINANATFFNGNVAPSPFEGVDGGGGGDNYMAWNQANNK